MSAIDLENEAAEEALLARAKPADADPTRSVLAIGVGTIMSSSTQAALDRLLLRGVLRLVDVALDGTGSGRLTRIFQVQAGAKRR